MFDADRRLLVIRRGKAPSAGSWSLPGGRCHPGEPPEVCCVREVAEETGLAVRVLRPAGRVERDAPDGSVYVIDDFVCALDPSAGTGARPRAGDDAADAAWVDRAALRALPLAPGVWDALAGWDLLPD